MGESLRGKVVVITGASSGIGREAAIQFARAGCKVVLAARRASDLGDAARECRDAGGEALVVVTDVTRGEQVQALADQAIARWGRIDVWVNNAGVTLFATLDRARFEEHRRVIETNVYGAMHGARVVVPIFRAQGRGVLINVGSVLSEIGQAFVPSYTISKFAVRGLSEALRVQLADDPDIHVCTLLPYAIDTPHFESGANEVGRHARAMPGVQTPEKVARAMVRLAMRPEREVLVPRIAALGLALHWAFPDTTERLLLRALERFHFDDERQARTTGDLYRPVNEGEGDVHGTRPPQLGVMRFAAWVLAELLRIEADVVSRRMGSILGARPTPPPRRDRPRPRPVAVPDIGRA